jgi:hypothetical protein
MNNKKIQIITRVIYNKNIQIIKKMVCVVIATLFSLNLLAATGGGGLYAKKTGTTTTSSSGTTNSGGIYSSGGVQRAGGSGTGGSEGFDTGAGKDAQEEYVDGGAAPLGDTIPFLLVLTALYGAYKYKKRQRDFVIN